MGILQIPRENANGIVGVAAAILAAGEGGILPPVGRPRRDASALAGETPAATATELANNPIAGTIDGTETSNLIPANNPQEETMNKPPG